MPEPTTPAAPDVVRDEEGYVPWYEPLSSRIGVTLLCVAAFAALGYAASYVLPPKYFAHGKIILPNSPSRSPLASVSGALGLGSVSDGGSLPMFAAILRSETMLVRLSDQTGLTRKQLRKILTVKDDTKSNTIEIDALGNDRKKILDVIRYSLIDLDRIKSSVNLPVKETQATRLGSELASREQRLAKAETALETFLRTAKTLPGGGVDLASTSSTSSDGSPKSGTSDMNSLQSSLGYKQQLTSLEIELQKLDSSVNAIQSASKAQERAIPLDLPPVQLWSEKIAAAQTKLAELRPRYRDDSPEVRDAANALTSIQRDMQRDVDSYLTSVRANIAGPGQQLSVTRAGVVRQIAEIKKYVDAAPEESIQYLRLFRNVATDEAVVNQIRLLYEKAMLDRSDDPNRWAILDQPELDDEFDPRSLKRNVAFGALLGLAVAYSFGSRRLAAQRRKKARPTVEAL